MAAGSRLAAWGRSMAAPRASTIGSLRLKVAPFQIALVLAVVVVWQLLTVSSEYWRESLSTPNEVAYRLWLWVTTSQRQTDIFITAEEAILGYLLGVVVAIPAASLLSSNRFLFRAASPFISALNAVPKVVLAPLFIMWFGLTLTSKVYFVAQASFFITFYGLYRGILSIDTEYVTNTRLLGANRLQLVREVYVPAVFTWLMASLRLAIAFSLLSAIIAEYVGANSGIGFQIALGQQTFRPDGVISGILVVGVIALGLDRALQAVERRFTKWRIF